MEEKDNKEMTSAVRDTIAYIVAENIIDSINTQAGSCPSTI
jgi:hypothetical protein